MSYRYGPSLQTGAYTYGRGGLGIPAELVPAEGLDGAAYFYAALSLPADNGIEISARITRYPVLGTLTLDGDEGRFSYVGATDYLLYELREWDVLDAADIGYGPSIGRVDLVVGAVVDLTPAAQSIVVVGGVPTIGQPNSLAPAAQQITVYGWAPLLSQVEGPPPVADPIRLLAIISQEIAFEATIEQA